MATVPSRPTDAAPGERRAGGPSFHKVAGYAAIVAAVDALVYAVAFVVLPRVAPDSDVIASFLAALALLVGSVASAIALVAVFERVRHAEPSFALLGLAFGLAGTLGAGVHGAYDLANAFHPPNVSLGSQPNMVDPRGFLTFFISGIALLVLNWAAARAFAFPARLAQLGYLLGALLVVIYLGRLIVLDPSSPLILVPAGLAAVIVSPLWYGWVGSLLLRDDAAG